MTLRSSLAAGLRRAAAALDVPPRVAFPLLRFVEEPAEAGDAATRAARGRVEAWLGARVARTDAARIDGPVLIDAMWRNPGYWLRASLLRTALGTPQRREVALLGRYQSREQSASARAMGIPETLCFPALPVDARKIRSAAAALAAGTRTADDIAGWRLPGGVPPEIAYDTLLKMQRSAVVDVGSSAFVRQVAEILFDIECAARTLDAVDPKFMVLSHTIKSSFGSLAWLALSRGIETVLAFGNYGVPRFYRLRAPDDVFRAMDMPDARTINLLSRPVADALAEVGRRHVELRLSGKTDDVGAHYAFRRAADAPTRDDVLAKFGWDPAKKIVVVYAPNWFDYPHTCGLTNFRDYLDWVQTTIAAAKENDSVNWLFRAHPADAWYGGVTLSDLVPATLPAHIRLCPIEWNGGAVAAFADAVTTVMGTAGLEYPCLGKPALLADRGWYSVAGVAVVAESREDYVAALKSPWWRRWDGDTARRRARIVAGLYFGMPADRPAAASPDDAQQTRLYAWQDEMLRNDPAAFEAEVASIVAWWNSGDAAYHAHKMLGATAWRPGNIDGAQVDVVSLKGKS